MKKIFLLFSLLLLTREAFSEPLVETLGNGVQVIVSEGFPPTIAGVSIMVEGGIRCEGRDERGTYSLLSDMLLRGTSSRNKNEIAKEIALLGDSVRSYTREEYWAIDATVPAASLRQYLELCRDLLFNPELSSEELEHVKRTRIQAVRASEDSPSGRLSELYRTVFYPDIHPSNAERIANISAADHTLLERVHGRYFVPERIVISIAGGIERGSAIEIAEDLFGGIPQGPSQAPEVHTVQKNDPLPLFRTEGGGVTQAGILYGTRLDGFSRKDEHILLLFGAVLDNSLGGRLFGSLRENKGLVYDIRTGYSLSIRPYTWYVITTSRRKNTQAVREETKKVLRGLTKDPPSEQEIEVAVNYLKTRLASQSLSPLFTARYNAERLLRGEEALSLERRMIILDGIKPEDLFSFISNYLPSRWTTLMVR